MSKTYSANLKRLRIERGLSQQEVGDRLSVGRSTYAGWENEAAEPPQEQMVRLARFFGVSVDAMLGADGILTGLTNQRAVRAMIEELLQDRCSIGELRQWWRNRINDAWSQPYKP